MAINENELLYSGVTNAVAWGTPMGFFALKMGFDHPAKRQIAIACLASAAAFSLVGSTVHYTVSKIYQNQPDTHILPSLTHRTTRVITSTLLTPLITATVFTIGTLNIRTSRQQSLGIIKQCSRPQALIAFAIGTIAIQILFSYIYSSGDKSTPILSKKTFTRLAASSLLSGSAVFFATYFAIL